MKYAAVTENYKTIAINRNMRCIEIVVLSPEAYEEMRINRNMRCIEICVNYPYLTSFPKINRNMRCIEIKPFVVAYLVPNLD